MKEAPLSKCERNFITDGIKQNLRLDGRKNDEFRDVKIVFGRQWGSVLVTLGETKVLAQVTCELEKPRATRPTEGMLFINVELGPMAAPHFEAGRHTELTVKINRTLERTFMDSRCLDLESLCVKPEECVWVLRVSLNVLNHMGNLIGCCSIAALSALGHFKRPDVTITHKDVHIHKAAEKEPIPMVLHHYPICISFSTFDEGKVTIADPTDLEERCGESHIVFGLNSFRELCCISLGGISLTSPHLLLQCANRAATRVKIIVDYIKLALEQDKEARNTGVNNGFTDCVRLNLLTSLADDRLSLRLRNFNFKDIFGKKAKQSDSGPEENVSISSAKLLVDKGNVQWVPDEDDPNVVDMDSNNSMSDSDDGDNNVQNVAESVEEALQLSSKGTSDIPHRSKSRKLSQRNPHQGVVNETDSEEDETMVL